MFKRHSLWAMGSVASAAGVLICGYEFVRSSSMTLFKTAYGVASLPIVMALLPVGLIILLYIYGRLLSWVGPRRTLLVTTLGAGVVIAACYVAIHAGIAIATGVLFIFREVYIVLIIEQYWSFVNSTVDESTARKLNGPLLALSGLGGAMGGLLVHRLAVPLGTEAMLLFAAAATVPAAFLSDLGYRHCGEPTPKPEEIVSQRDHLGLNQFRERRVAILFLVIFATQVLSAVLELRFQGILQEAIPNPDQQTAYSGGFFGLLQGIAAPLQFIGTPLVLKFISLRVIHALIPLIHVTTCIVLTLSPSLFVAAGAFFLFKSFDYSIFRAAKEILYIPLPFDVRYRAKEVIDVFGYRFGKGGTSLAIALIQRTGVVVAPFFSLIGASAAIVWFILSFPLTRPSRTEKTFGS